jgi:hypothetical protein
MQKDKLLKHHEVGKVLGSGGKWWVMVGDGNKKLKYIIEPLSRVWDRKARTSRPQFERSQF